jgi:hypothetical protein
MDEVYCRMRVIRNADRLLEIIRSLASTIVDSKAHFGSAEDGGRQRLNTSPSLATRKRKLRPASILKLAVLIHKLAHAMQKCPQVDLL